MRCRRSQLKLKNPLQTLTFLLFLPLNVCSRLLTPFLARSQVLSCSIENGMCETLASTSADDYFEQLKRVWDCRVSAGGILLLTTADSMTARLP